MSLLPDRFCVGFRLKLHAKHNSVPRKRQNKFNAATMLSECASFRDNNSQVLGTKVRPIWNFSSPICGARPKGTIRSLPSLGVR